MVLKTSFTTVCLILGSIVAQSNQYQPADTYKTQPVPEVDLTKSVSEFALDFYDQCVNSKPGNVIISPFLVANSLALLSQASNGNTFNEITTALHLNSDKSTVANLFTEYNGKVQLSVGDATLLMTNHIFVQDGNKLSRNFQEVAESNFGSEVELMDFSDPTASAETINHFVEEKTNNKIHNFVPPNLITSDTLIFLASAIYFKSNWEIQFDKQLTQEREFYISENETIPTDFMYTNQRFNFVRYVEDLEASALEMKYANSSMSFLMILPANRTGLSELEAKIKNYNLTEVTSQMAKHRVDVFLPKFKAEYEIELNDVLKNMGMTNMFGSDADLDGLLQSTSSLKLSTVLHKAFIEVNEEGSEAAAASGTGITKKSSTPKFEADHPFMYFIRDTENDVTLFSGRFEKVEEN